MNDQFASKYAFALEDDSSPANVVTTEALKWDDGDDFPIFDATNQGQKQPQQAVQIEVQSIKEPTPSILSLAVDDQQKLIKHEKKEPVLVYATEGNPQIKEPIKPAHPIKIDEIKTKKEALSKFFQNLLSDSEEEESQQEQVKIIQEHILINEEIQVTAISHSQNYANDETMYFQEEQQAIENVIEQVEPATSAKQLEEPLVIYVEPDKLQNLVIDRDKIPEEFVQQVTPLEDEWQEEERKSLEADCFEENKQYYDDIEEIQQIHQEQQIIQDSNAEFKPSKTEIDEIKAIPQTFEENRLEDDVELSTEISIEIEPYHKLMEPSSVFVIQQLSQALAQPNKTVPRLQRAPILFSFPHSKHTLDVINRSKLTKKAISMTDLNDKCLMQCLHEMVKLDPIKIVNSDYARAQIAQKVEEYLDSAKIGVPEKQVWKLFSKIISIKRNQGTASQTLLICEYQAQIIEDILQGQSLREALLEMPVNKQNNNQQSADSCYMAKAINYESKNDWAVSIDSLIFELVKNDYSALSLVIASLMMGEAQRNEIFSDFILQNVPPENPLFCLLMIQIGKGDYILENQKTKSRILTNWRLNLAFLLSNFKNPQANLEQLYSFINHLADLVLTENQDVWGYCYLKLLTLSTLDLLFSPQAPSSSLRISLSLNYLQTLTLPLAGHPNQEKMQLELTYYRALIYSRSLGLHELAHEEYHTIIEKREVLLSGIPNEIPGKKGLSGQQYMQFMLRELKQQEFEWIRRKQTQNMQIEKNQQARMVNRTEDRQREEVSRIEESERNANPNQSGFFTEFKGLFKRVIGNQMQMGPLREQQHLNDSQIMQGVAEKE
ncbi:hypothetical protein FGO68_gene3721 [Halteria grandinella]|uniref:Uncharacterized protein n=1 Tax=Halteria grandinella TaxID=5974 RepID=A0A8J8P914_HALGN|nr:hypothetical protein FGO68_gene3721 [Halteria grandinella]